VITTGIIEKNKRYGHNFVEGLFVGRLPNKFYNTEPVSGGYATRTDLHEVDGWMDVVMPSYNTFTQKLGGYYVDGNVVTHEVIDKTEQEIQNALLSQSEAEKEQKIKEYTDSMILQEAYNETDIPTILENTALYPLFEVGVQVWNEADAPNGIPTRVKDFNNDNELVLWECIQSHVTQGDWRPKDVPALFKRVAEDGEIPVWVQPTGAHDAYQIGDIVWYPEVDTQKWISKINSNTTVPDGDEPFNRYWEHYNV